MKKAAIFLFCFLQSYSSISQSFSWAQAFGSPIGNESGVTTIAIDDSNNVYSLGGFKNTVDFNAGTGVNNLTAIGTVNGFLLKEDANGNFIWVKPFYGLSSGSIGIWGTSILFDSLGNILIAGCFQDSFDVDPGLNVHKISAPYTQDAFVLKLNHNGDFLWEKHFGNNSSSINSSIGQVKMRFDTFNNIYLSYTMTGTIDVDPSNNVVLVTTTGNSNSILEKLDSSGNFIWYKQIGGNNYITSFAFTKDDQNNLYIGGHFNSTVDFDPSLTNTVNATSSGGYDIFIEKLDSAGNFIWAKQIGESSGDEEANSISVDDDGKVLITGFFEGTMDFNPGAGIFNLNAPAMNAFILKLNTSGDFIWAKSIYGNGSTGDCIVTDSNNNVYVTGTNYGCDFDPGTNTFLLNTQGDEDIYVERLDSSGSFIGAVDVGTTGLDFSNTIILDNNNNIIVSGVIGAYNFPGSGDFDPGPSVFTMLGNNYGFLEKLCNSIPLQLNANTLVFCEGDTALLYTPPMTNTSFQWVKDGTIIPNYTGDTLKVYQSGNYSVGIAGNSCAQSTTFFMQALPMGHPTISILAPTTVPFGQQATVTVNLTGITGAYLIHWFVNGQMFTTNNSATFSYTKTWGIDTVFASILAQAPCNDTSLSATAFIMATEGITSIPSQPQFLIFPNPTKDQITIQYSQAGSFVLTDIAGRVLLQASTPLNYQKAIDISMLAKGVYLLRFSSNEGAVETVKVVKE